jgi:VWFA-related protein
MRVPTAIGLVGIFFAGIGRHEQNVQLRSTAHGVRIDVVVTQHGRAVQDLRASDFEVLDSGVPQLVDAAVVAGHVAVAFVVDASLSVRVPGFDIALAACDRLVALLRPGDHGALVVFSDRVMVVVPPTETTGDLLSGLAAVRHFGAGSVPRSTVWDAVLAGAAQVAQRSGRPIVILASDGMDNASVLSKEKVGEILANAAMPVDLIRMPWDRGSADQYGPGRQAPEELSDRTGGSVFNFADSGLVENYRRRFDSLRQSYVLTYTPRGVPTDNGWHEVKVRVPGRDVNIKARRGYYANRGGE